ncbi:MAG: (2Fe-2S)-binding protein [Planctomycetota bacterium]
MSSNDRPRRGFTRRRFLAGMPAAAALPSVLSASSPSSAPAAAPAARVLGPGPVPVRIEVNGESRKALVEPRTTLLELLRDHWSLTGAKEVCELGACGACTVLLDDRPVNACLTLALECEGRKVLTIEGLSKDGELHPIQQAFVAHDALQCGYCTPGMVMAAHACLSQDPGAGRDELRAALAGNLCRCGTYTRIVAACEDAGRAMREGGGR